MTESRSLDRTRPELAAFLRSRRERISPEDVGLPLGKRRRTPGLRREEVAALAGVGLTWYTWLEQGRSIGVSTAFLDRLSKALKLDATERRHLFLLALDRPPSEPGKTWCTVPPLIHRLMGDLATSPSYVMNLRWDVLAFNPAADRVFRFSSHAADRRNMLWMLFTDPLMRRLLMPWSEQAHQMLSSFRRDFARARNDPDVVELVTALCDIDPDFRTWWQAQDIHAPCHGVRHMVIETIGTVQFEHTILTVDEDRHLRLVYYAVKRDGPGSTELESWLQDGVGRAQ